MSIGKKLRSMGVGQQKPARGLDRLMRDARSAAASNSSRASSGGMKGALRRRAGIAPPRGRTGSPYPGGAPLDTMVQTLRRTARRTPMHVRVRSAV